MSKIICSSRSLDLEDLQGSTSRCAGTLDPWIQGSTSRFCIFAPFGESLALCTQICTFTVHMIPKASMWTNSLCHCQQILQDWDETFNLDRIGSFAGGFSFEGCNIGLPNHQSYFCISDSDWTVFYLICLKFPFEIWDQWMGKAFIYLRASCAPFTCCFVNSALFANTVSTKLKLPCSTCGL